MNNLEGYNSDYREIVTVIPFEQFLSTYSELKDEYSADEVMTIFKPIEEDYDKSIKSDTVKKLELKNKDVSYEKDF